MSSLSPRAVGWLYVAAQFAQLAVLVFVPVGNLWPTDGLVDVVGWVFIVGGLALVVVAGAGLGASLSANPVPTDNGALRTTGLYAVVRHPIYLGLLTLALGLTINGASIRHILALGILSFILHMKARFEERLLIAKFPEYAEYAKRVGRLVPRLDQFMRRKNNR
jgi:protein-S-isoprenylcysteine O-methyltransferase Ste14